MKAFTTIGKNIAQARETHGMTQEELASKAGITVPYLIDIEGDKADPRVFTTVADIARALNVEVSDLFKGI